MKKRSEALAQRLRAVLLDGYWIANTNYKDQLQGVPFSLTTQEVKGLNSIAALTFHINYYLEGLLHAFKTGRLEISDQFSFDLPPMQSEQAWQNLLKAFLSNSEKFSQKVEEMDDEQLDQPFLDGKYGTNLQNIEAVIEHSYYHLGQLSLIKKLLSQKNEA